MKNKKAFLLIITTILVIGLVSCSNRNESSKIFDKEEIKPYKLSQNEDYILEAFGMKGNSQIISFYAPKEAISLKVNIYRLENSGDWNNISSGYISIGKDRQPIERLEGNLAMQLRKNNVIDFNINVGGKASYTTDEIILDEEIMASGIYFLDESKEIEINKEIPVALMVYDSGSKIESYSLRDYFEPSKFKGMDLVQAVSLVFIDEEL